MSVRVQQLAWYKVLLGTGYLFSVQIEGFSENYPFLFEGLQNILKGMWRAGPRNKGNSPSIFIPWLTVCLNDKGPSMAVAIIPRMNPSGHKARGSNTWHAKHP